MQISPSFVFEKYNMNQKQIRGGAGEEIVAQHYADNGYIIVRRNFRVRGGEIDLIAENEQEVVFVEVKTRDQKTSYRPYESVWGDQQNSIKYAANIFLSRSKMSAFLRPRFDVAEVWLDGDDYTVNITENAF